MKKTIHKLMYIFGTVLLMLGTLMSTGMSVVNAISVQSLSSSAAKVSSTKGSSAKSSLNLANSSSNSVNVQVASSSHSQAVLSQNNSHKDAVAESQSAKAQSTVANTESSNSSVSSSAVNASANKVQPVLASATTSSSTASPTPIGETTITSTLAGAQQGSQGFYPHFHTANGDITYCYNWKLQAPDETNGVDYNQYKFYDGLQSVTGDQTKVDKVAAALEAGYHKDATSNKYEVAPQFQSIADQSYQEILKEGQGNDINPQNNGPLYGNLPSNYTEAEFEEDVTQSVIWYLDGAPDTSSTNSDGTHTYQPGYLATHTALGKAILAYAQQHPLDQNTAYPKNVAVKDSNGTVNDSNPLVMDPTTKLSQPFQLTNYNGGVSISNLPKGYEIVDANGNVVTQVQSGQNYRVKYVGSGNPSNTTANNTVNKIQAKASYEALKDSNFFSAKMTNASSTAVNKYQNMVNLTTTENTFNFPIIWSSISSSSSVSSASSKESSESSISSVSSVKSSSASSSSKKSSSSVKSSSVVSSSKKSSSSVKSSSVVSSSKKSSSSVKSSSVVSSSKKSSSSVKSSSIASSKKATTKSSSVVSSSKKSSSSVKSSSIASSKKSSSSVKSSSIASSKKSSSSAKSSSVASSKKSSSSAKSSSVESSKKATAKSSSIASSKKATTKSSSVASSKKATTKSSSANTEKATTSTTEGSSSAKKAVVVGVHNNTNSGKGTGHGQGQGKGEGEGHGMPQTGEAVATSLVVAGVVLLATAGAITLRKRN